MRTLINLTITFILINFLTIKCKASEMRNFNDGNVNTVINKDPNPDKIKISEEKLRNKIRGGWAGQVIGVSFGGPYEFKYLGETIPEDITIVENFDHELVVNDDDVSLDVNFLEVLHRYGLNATPEQLSSGFVNASYPLWHGNQAARYNILNGIPASEAGHWKNNLHADDIDFQIESDFIGLISPGLPKTALEISDKVGHIIAYGDGWYGGLYKSVIYSLALLTDNTSDLEDILIESLQSIPEKSDFYKCIKDVIDGYKQYPDSWLSTWQKIQTRWGNKVIACQDGVFRDLNIDSKINFAYVVMALLYGQGDFTKTMEIAVRAGQDTDCNASSAGGILGAILGYENIPNEWKEGYDVLENKQIKDTRSSLNQVYEKNLDLINKNVLKEGGSYINGEYEIQKQSIETARLEVSFPNIYPKEKIGFGNADLKQAKFKFKGTGIMLIGGAIKNSKNDPSDYVLKLNVWIDGKKVGNKISLPTSYTTRKVEVFSILELDDKEHEIKLKVTNPDDRFRLLTKSYVVYE